MMAVTIKCILPRTQLVPRAMLKPSKLTPTLIRSAKSKNVHEFRSEWFGIVGKNRKKETLELTLMEDSELKVVMTQMLLQKYANDLNVIEFKQELLNYYTTNGIINPECDDTNLNQLELMLLLFSHRQGSDQKSKIDIHTDLLQYYAMHYMYDSFKQAYLTYLKIYSQKEFLSYAFSENENKIQEAFEFFNPYGHE